jgi:PAS domain S-box-containing protein
MKVHTRLSDLSELDQAHAALRESDDRFRELAEHMRDVSWLSDVRTGGFLYANPAYYSLTLQSREQLYDNPEQWFESIHEDDRLEVEGAWGTIDDEFHGWNFEYRVTRPDGTERWVQERAFPVCNPDGQAYRIAGITEDITEERKQRLRSRELTHQLDLEHEAQQREVVDILHDDVSQNLVVVSFALDELSQKLPAGLQEEVTSIRKRIGTVIETTRTLTTDMNSDLYKLGFWAELETLSHELLESGVTVNLDDQCSDVRLADKVSVVMYRSVRELLHNVLKHAETTTARVTRSCVDNRMIVEVDDAGAGFDVNAVNKQASCNGLFLTQERIWSLGGTLTIDSQPRCGTRVIISVPCEST